MDRSNWKPAILAGLVLLVLGIVLPTTYMYQANFFTAEETNAAESYEEVSTDQPITWRWDGVSGSCRVLIRNNPPGWMYDAGAAVSKFSNNSVEYGMIGGKGSAYAHTYYCMEDEIFYLRTDQEHGVKMETSQ